MAETETRVRPALTRLETLAPILLAISVIVRLASTMGAYFVTGDFFFDLHVYVIGGAALNHPGTLYDVFYVDPVKGEHLAFTYPTFAAIIFYPLHLLPFGLIAFLWQVAQIGAVYGSVRLSQRFLGGGSRRIAMVWTAAALWLEPVASNFQTGQVGVFLMLGVLYAAYSTRWWVSGLLIGVGAGIKLTPATTGFYFLGMRRWAAAAFSAVAYFGTVAVAYLAFRDDTSRYFPGQMIEAGRTLPVGSSWNQSWLGGISRIVGHDAGPRSLVIVAIAATAVLTVLAWRALGSGTGERDRLGSLLVVQLLGLMAAPVSWIHHWVWVVPLMVWLIHGPWRDKPGAKILGWGWLVLMVVSVPSLLSLAQPNIMDFSRPWYLAWAGLVYIAASLTTLVWIIVTGRRV
ncbi:mannosyltransferase [Mycobacterium hodleri]|uniref:mannosyltransferase n=1 Tax=Mycolicibacterium hodleri TaxID=49897 RepID=UPI0021F32046|nr:mannosyltransferase [Mycolicibacterium hodleri]MCV7133519.1 mannosyltransferase [Mycolicibacterium hodleri]